MSWKGSHQEISYLFFPHSFTACDNVLTFRSNGWPEHTEFWSAGGGEFWRAGAVPERQELAKRHPGRRAGACPIAVDQGKGLRRESWNRFEGPRSRNLLPSFEPAAFDPQVVAGPAGPPWICGVTANAGLTHPCRI